MDEFTGRLMIGRRYNEGLHQAIEAKEGVKIAADVYKRQLLILLIGMLISTRKPKETRGEEHEKH